MSDSVLIVERLDEATAVLTFNRPARRNALSIELMDTLCRSLGSLAADPRVRVAILRGAGPAFCSGLDLAEAARAELAEQSAHCVARSFQTLAESPLVTIAAAQGAAYAGGAGLMASCDFVVAAEDLRIAFPEVRRGLVPALAALALGSRLSEGDRRELVLLAEPIDARRALEIGLVDRVVSSEQIMATAREIAATVLKGGPEAVRQTKRLLRALAPGDRSQLFAQAVDFHNQARTSSEAREGLAAFLEHREPNWPGGIE